MQATQTGITMIVEHVRKNDRRPYATLIAYKTEGGDIRFGYSKYAKKLEAVPFSKQSGREIAAKNADYYILLLQGKSRGTADRKNGKDPHSLYIPVAIETTAIRFLKRVSKYFNKIPCNVVIHFEGMPIEWQNISSARKFLMED